MRYIEGTKLTCSGYRCTLHCSRYTNNDRLAIIATTESGEPFGILTVNLDAPIPDGCLAIKNWSENEELARVAFDTGLFVDTGERIRTGYVHAPVWEIAYNVKPTKEAKNGKR